MLPLLQAPSAVACVAADFLPPGAEKLAPAELNDVLNRQRIARSSVVVLARVLSQTRSGGYVRHQLLAERVWKTDGGLTLEAVSPARSDSSCTAQLEVGRTYLLLARRLPPHRPQSPLLISSNDAFDVSEDPQATELLRFLDGT